MVSSSSNGDSAGQEAGSSLSFSPGTWQPPGSSNPSHAHPRPLTARPGSSSARARPGSSSAKRLRPSSSRLSSNEAAALYDGGSVLQHAAFNSFAVEERALDHEVKRHLLTLPDKTGSQSMRPVSASFYSKGPLSPTGAGSPDPHHAPPSPHLLHHLSTPFQHPTTPHPLSPSTPSPRPESRTELPTHRTHTVPPASPSSPLTHHPTHTREAWSESSRLHPTQMLDLEHTSPSPPGTSAVRIQDQGPGILASFTSPGINTSGTWHHSHHHPHPHHPHTEHHSQPLPRTNTASSSTPSSDMHTHARRARSARLDTRWGPPSSTIGRTSRPSSAAPHSSTRPASATAQPPSLFARAQAAAHAAADGHPHARPPSPSSIAAGGRLLSAGARPSLASRTTPRPVSSKPTAASGRPHAWPPPPPQVPPPSPRPTSRPGTSFSFTSSSSPPPLGGALSGLGATSAPEGGHNLGGGEGSDAGSVDAGSVNGGGGSFNGRPTTAAMTHKSMNGATSRPISATSIALQGEAAVSHPIVVPGKFPVCFRPISGFSAASSATRSNPAAAALKALNPNQTSVAEQPVYNLEAELPEGICTSQDVVDYFTQHGHSAAKKLFYLNKATPPSPYHIMSPFDLVVVPASKVEREHWTMSVMGVVHIVQGEEKEAEFMELGEWIRLSSIYGMLRKMRVFKHYYIYKSFSHWRKLVRRLHYKRVRTEIARMLFPSMPTFQPYIGQVRNLLTEIENTHVLSISNRPDKLYMVDEFMEDQDHHREKVVAPSLSSKITQVIEIITELCSKVETERLRMETMTDIQVLQDNDFKVGIPSMVAGQKNKSISAMKEERRALLHQYQRICHECSRLRYFVRLIDYMVGVTIVRVGVSAAADLLAYFEDPNKSRGCFNTTVSYMDRPKEYKFEPPHIVVAELTAHVIDSAVHMCHDLPRPLTSKSLTAKFMDAHEQIMNVYTTTLGAPEFQAIRAACMGHVDSSFKSAQEYVVATFEDKRVVENARLTWNLADYEAKNHTLSSIRRDLVQKRKWGRMIDQMKMSNTVGILFVDSKQMRAALQHLVAVAIEDIKTVLSAFARKNCHSVLEQVRQWNKELEARPSDLHGFARLKQRHQVMEAQKGELFKAIQAVDDMYDTFRDYGGKVELRDHVQLDNLHDELAVVKVRLEEVYDWVALRHEDMVGAMNGSSHHLVESVHGLLQEELSSGPLNDPEADITSMLDLVDMLEAKLNGMEEESKLLTQYQELMKEPQEDYGLLLHVRREFERRKKAWTTLAEWSTRSHEWMHAPVESIKGNEVQSTVDEFFKSVFKLSKMYRDDMVVVKTKEQIEDFKAYLPLFMEVGNPAMQKHHWMQVLALVGVELDPEHSFSVGNLVQWGIFNNMEAISNISTAASKEYSLRQALTKMKEEWAGKEFYCIPYKDSGTAVIGQTDEIQMLLDDQLMKVAAMNASPFVKPFKQESHEWEAMLRLLQDLLDQWLTCQATWLYLEPIFSSADIIKQMPEEGAKFARVDTAFRSLMEEVQLQPACIALAKEPDRLYALEEANKLLEEVQKGLAAYLEKKRLFFPRFFFLSNDEMLEILSETKDPTRVQPHLRKCFEGIHRLKFEGPIVRGMQSIEQESVPFKTPINTAQAKGAVERWLLEVEARMFEAVHDVTARGIENFPSKPRHEWVLDWPGMVVLVVTAVYWTRDVEAAISKHAVPAFEKKCTEDLMKIVDLVRGGLTALQRGMLGALVVMDVHARDVVADLAREGVQDGSDFGWQAQLRSYWEGTSHHMPGQGMDVEQTVMMRMMNSSLEYGYEYLGNSSRLVITPLTDRCYRTLMGAIHMNLGGAPEGPAGTGKTETTKDLAKALARQCVVFNCSDSLDYIAMGKFFKGLAASGAWACFDEFNRIDLEVLSVVAQQVMDIQRAIAAHLSAFYFEGTDLQLKWTAWCAITMNPGYAGRSELPDNLKALFRTVAMMVPDYAMIAEIMLFSYGYLAARESAKKIVQCYKLCSEQLSSQDHYDYGMRAVMAVLRAAGNLKRRYPQEDEYVLMLRSIMDVNLCKFLSQDVPLFMGIISDLFPGITLPPSDYKLMTAAIEEASAAANLQPTPYFTLKIVQLYEMIIVRHGLMVVGLPFSGKTAGYRILAEALNIMHAHGQDEQQAAQYHVINPKAVTIGQLYGQFDAVSHEWSDGVLAVLFRKCASDPSPTRKWLVLDGPVDAIWIENMNTVLDDNKKLCLNSGEIIAMSPAMNMIFEVMDLAAASPATVSRCGMVYLEPHQLGVAPLLTSWLNALPSHYPAAMRERLAALFNAYAIPMLRFVRKEVRESCPTPDGNAAVSLMRLWASLAEPLMGTPERMRETDPTKLREAADALFMFALVYSVCATAATMEGRVQLQEFMKALVACRLEEYVSPSGHSYHDPEAPFVEISASILPPPVGIAISTVPQAKDESCMHDWMYDTDTLMWRKWIDLVGVEPIPEDASFRSIIVPTADSVAITFMLRSAIESRYPLLLVGPTGTGKSAYTVAYLSKLDPERYTPPNILGFSAQTSASMAQSLIDSKLDKRRKGVYGPPVGKRAVVFVDDLNMPMKQVYGAQPPIELLRQFMDHGGWYDTDNSFRHMQDVQFIAAMGPPGGGRTAITPRYVRHFHVLAITDASDATLKHIFSTIQEWFLTTRNFPKPVIDLKDMLVQATADIYHTVTAQLLPTPSKSHYVFNLRDFSRVIQGVQMQKPNALTASAQQARCSVSHQHMKLWCHEVMRVFYDRLVDEEEQTWFLDTLKRTTHRFFRTDFDSLFAHLTGGSGVGGATPVTGTHLRRCFFGDFLSEMDETGEQPYMEILSPEAVISKMEDYLMDYNSLSRRPMNLAMFLYAVEHIARAVRVLRQEGGHLLCVGVGGSGRQSLSRLAGFIAGMEVFQVEISRNYGMYEWREDLKYICKKAGSENKPSVFLFSDTQIKNMSFVEDVNNLLNSGEVPNMFPYDERSAIGETVRALSKKMGRQLDTPNDLWAFFVERTRANLHVVLCFSPIGDSFRNRLRQFPSIINCCTIDWFQRWPEDALEAVARKFLKEVDVMPDMLKTLVGMCKQFHMQVTDASTRFLEQTGRHNYVTPTSYLELIIAFTSLVSTKRAEVLGAQHRYEKGLDKLEFTAKQVSVMRKELQALKPNLEHKGRETETLLNRITHEKAHVVEPKKAQVDVEVKEADAQAQVSRGIKDECENILAEAMPALNSAISALATIKAADIRLVQTFKNPPAAVKLVMEAVCVLLDVKPTMVPDPNVPGKKIPDYWDASKKLLMDTHFIDRLREYDRDNIQPRIIEKVRKEYITNEEFTPQNAAKGASAAEGLCKWVHAMNSYDRVAKVVAPKKAKLKEAEAAYAKVMEGLKGKQEELNKLMSQLATLEKNLSNSVEEKERLEAEVEKCSLKLDRAQELISGLGGEKERWMEAAHALRGQFGGILGDMLLSAAVISYLGAFTSSYRDELIAQWVKACKKVGIATSPKYSLAGALAEPVRVRSWVIAGLPNDTFSIDNAIMLTNARRWPLCIDPQKQANKWIKNMEADNKLSVVKLTDSDYMRTLENSIAFGLPVLMENVGEELDACLDPLLLKQTFKQAGAICIKLGDNTVEFSKDFRFYITTVLRNPHYLPETAVKVTLLNFMITQEGLADQLLGVVVAQEMPDLEEQRQQLVVSSAENKRKLKEIEDQILEVLSKSQGNILEDATAVQVLSEAKQVSNDVTQKQAVAEETQAKLDVARRGYRSCGEYNAVLFFCIADLGGIDTMYQYSLSWFIGLFVRAISNSARSDALPRRLEAINNLFTYMLYTNVCRSLFEKDKLLFAFLLATRIMAHKKMLPQAEYEYLVTGGASALGQSDQSVLPNPDPSWISAKTWAELGKLGATSETFSTLQGHISLAKTAWRQAMHDSSSPHTQPLPEPFNSSLSSFQRLLVLRVLRPDKFVPAVSEFVATSLGPKFTQPPAFDLAAAYAESSCSTPLLFVLSPGTDPTAALLSFAESRNMAGPGRFMVISMGQGQGPKAAAMLEDARSMGAWVLLQNCHLAPSWMSTLERQCEALSESSTDEGFRLWMSCMPSPAFPPSVLQNCVKMTNEPPAGLKNNMRRCLVLEPLNDPNFWEDPVTAEPEPASRAKDKKHPPRGKKGTEAEKEEEEKHEGPITYTPQARAVKRLLFGLVFMHACVQERRRFGPIGWNIPYGFDDGDLRISARQARMYVLNAHGKEVPFAALQYAVGECNYGGRVTDDKDRRLLTTILSRIYRPELLQEDTFQLTESGTYYVPPDGPLSTYQSYIEQLPNDQAPEVFGLHANADISKDLAATEQLLASLVATGESGGGAGGGEGSNASVAAIVRDILERLPPDFDLEQVQQKYPVSYHQSMNQVLIQEMARYNRLTSVIRSSLINLDKAIQGLQVLSSELEGVLRALAIGRVPQLWQATSFPSLKPLAGYINDLMARLDMLRSWYQDGQPTVFWISGFFFTPSFTTAVLQNFARKHQLPIDSIGFDFEMMKGDAASLKGSIPEGGGVYIHGLFMEGAAWDGEAGMMKESEPKVLHVLAPIIWLKPQPLSEIQTTPHYDCPVYRTTERKGTLATTGHSTNFLMMIRLPTDKPQWHWILRGVCMLCSLTDD